MGVGLFLVLVFAILLLGYIAKRLLDLAEYKLKHMPRTERNKELYDEMGRF